MTDLPLELVRHYRDEADRVRKLASEAVFPEVREALLSVVRQYEALAEGLGDQDGHTGRSIGRPAGLHRRPG